MHHLPDFISLFYHHLFALHTPLFCLCVTSPADFNLCHICARREKHLCIAVYLLLIFVTILAPQLLFLDQAHMVPTFPCVSSQTCPFTSSVYRCVMAVDIGQVTHLLWQHEDLLISPSLILYLVIISTHSAVVCLHIIHFLFLNYLF